MTIPIGISSAGTKTVPGTPTIESVTDVGTSRPFNNGAVTVTFTAPTDDGRLPITSFTASGYCSTHGTVHTTTGASSPLTITGFGSSITSPITVVATNSVGPSIASIAVTSPTITSIPQVLTIGTATATGTTTATVAFTPGSTGGKAVTFVATSSPGGITGSGTSPITVSGLTASTTYTFTIVASNANGSTAASSASNSITTNAPSPSFVAPTFPSFVAPTFPTFTVNPCAGVNCASYGAPPGGTWTSQGFNAQPWDPHCINAGFPPDPPYCCNYGTNTCGSGVSYWTSYISADGCCQYNLYVYCACS